MVYLANKNPGSPAEFGFQINSERILSRILSTYPGHPGICLAGTLTFAGRVFEPLVILTESTTTSGLQSHPFKRGEDERGFSDGKTGSQMGRDLPQAPQLVGTVAQPWTLMLAAQRPCAWMEEAQGQTGQVLGLCSAY